MIEDFIGYFTCLTFWNQNSSLHVIMWNNEVRTQLILFIVVKIIWAVTATLSFSHGILSGSHEHCTGTAQAI